MTKYTEGVCDDGAAILKDGEPMAVSEILATLNHAERMRQALERIERWFGEFPATGEKWPSGEPMSYGAAYGSNGERDFMRQVAREALCG